MSEIKRLLCIVSAMNAGGAETFLMKIYKKLNKKKYQMDFCVNNPKKGFYDDKIEALGGKIFVIPCKSDCLRDFKNGLSEIIQTNEYEHVLRITSNAMGFYDLKIAKDNGAQTCIARSSNSSDGFGIKVKVAHLLGKVLFRKYVDIKMAPSDLAAIYTFGEKVYKKGGVKILHNAVDLDEYKYSITARKRIRNNLNIAEDTFVVGHIGRFSEQKNHTFLLKIFKSIIEKRENSLLVLVGEGELKEKIMDQAIELGIYNHILFLGIRSDIPELLSAFDVFLFPSFYEGMPNTIIEAQATGLKCILADTITREADITGLLIYKSLKDLPDNWAIEALNCIGKERRNTKDAFISNGYDIEQVTRRFEKIIFEEG